MKRFELCLLIGLVAAVLCGNVAAFGAGCEQVREDVLRIHILANSDSEEDQQLKLYVRDALLEASGSLFAGSGSLAGAEEAAAASLPQIEEIARQTLRTHGCDCPVQAYLVNMYFETRQYEGFTMPAGRYDALRVVIGQGGGRNWWCVMYPPICLPAVIDTGAQEEGALTPGQMEMLQTTPVFEPRFAVVEWIERLTGSAGAPQETICLSPTEGASSDSAGEIEDPNY